MPITAEVAKKIVVVYSGKQEHLGWSYYPTEAFSLYYFCRDFNNSPWFRAYETCRWAWKSWNSLGSI